MQPKNIASATKQRVLGVIGEFITNVIQQKETKQHVSAIIDEIITKVETEQHVSAIDGIHTKAETKQHVRAFIDEINTKAETKQHVSAIIYEILKKAETEQHVRAFIDEILTNAVASKQINPVSSQPLAANSMYNVGTQGPAPQNTENNSGCCFKALVASLKALVVSSPCCLIQGAITFGVISASPPPAITGVLIGLCGGGYLSFVSWGACQIYDEIKEQEKNPRQT